MKLIAVTAFAVLGLANAKTTCDQINKYKDRKGTWCLKRNDCKWVSLKGVYGNCQTSYDIPESELSLCNQIRYMGECKAQTGSRCTWKKVLGERKCRNNKNYVGPEVTAAPGSDTVAPRAPCTDFSGGKAITCTRRIECKFNKVSKMCTEKTNTFAPVTSAPTKACEAFNSYKVKSRSFWCKKRSDCAYYGKPFNKCQVAGDAAPTKKPTEPQTAKPTLACDEFNGYKKLKSRSLWCNKRADCTYYGKPFYKCQVAGDAAPTQEPTDPSTAKPTLSCDVFNTYKLMNRKKWCDKRNDCTYYAAFAKCQDAAEPAPTKKPTNPETDKPTDPETDKPTDPETDKPTDATEEPTEKPTLACDDFNTYKLNSRSFWCQKREDCTYYSKFKECRDASAPAPTDKPVAPQKPTDAECKMLSGILNKAACNNKNGCVFNPNSKKVDPNLKPCKAVSTKEWCNQYHGQESTCVANASSGCRWSSVVSKCQVA